MNTDIAVALASDKDIDTAVVLSTDTMKALRAWYENFGTSPEPTQRLAAIKAVSALMAVCSDVFDYRPERKPLVAFADNEAVLALIRGMVADSTEAGFCETAVESATEALKTWHAERIDW